ncbi:MAG: gfo/Idh/MocA family oxidoreductase [Luteitalea sp.]|nr:gfo/Idh/MocA family oxidoreductase [Luteitalea sp.]
MSTREIRFGIIGGGMMGREFASASARWCHLLDLDFAPKPVAVCDTSAAALDWFSRSIPGITVTSNHEDLLGRSDIDAIYCAVPHHLHAELYQAVIRAGKHLLGEKPFGIHREANRSILEAIEARPGVVVRCSSEFPFFPGAQRMLHFIREGRFGRIIEVEAGFHHSSDLDPHKKINWKRRVAYNGEYGCMGDLGMHVLHIPLRFGWLPDRIFACLSNIVTSRPDEQGEQAPCETWDNATLAGEVPMDGYRFPVILSTKRIAPGEMNTWFLRIFGTRFSAEFSTKLPKQIRTLPYASGQPQAWHVADVGYESCYPAVTGGIFEFGFPDAILQMWAAFCDELVNGRERMKQPFYCVTPEETALSHRVLTSALESQRKGTAVDV